MRNGLKIKKGKNYDQARRDNRCVACSGSGYYDATGSKGRPIECGACDGTGQETTDV